MTGVYKIMGDTDTANLKSLFKIPNGDVGNVFQTCRTLSLSIVTHDAVKQLHLCLPCPKHIPGLQGSFEGNFPFFSFLDQALGYDMQDINHSFPGG